MESKIQFVSLWLRQNKRFTVNLLLLLILARFVFLICYNWYHGNTGAPGVQYYVDSYRYMDGAQNLLNGTPFGHKEAEYIGYIALLAFVKWLSMPMVTVVGLQVLIALLSAWFLFDLAKKISGSSLAGVITVWLYLDNPFITVWHLYILTESLYTSFLIISVWAIAKACEKRSFKWYLLSSATVFITASIRPNGWILLPLMFSAFIICSGYKRSVKYTGAGTIVILFLVVVAFLPLSNRVIQKVEGNMTMNDLLVNGEVVWGHPELRLHVPQDSSLHSQNWIYGYSYILKHPLACTKLAAYRVASELLEINRPWYSLRYQVLLLLWLWPAYLLAVIGIIRYKSNLTITITLTVIAAHLLIIALTYAEHEHRFLNYVLPLIYLISACGVATLIRSFAAYLDKGIPKSDSNSD